MFKLVVTTRNFSLSSNRHSRKTSSIFICGQKEKWVKSRKNFESRVSVEWELRDEIKLIIFSTCSERMSGWRIQYTHFKRKIFRFSDPIHTHTFIDRFCAVQSARIYTHKSGDVREGGQKRYNNKNNNKSNNNVDSATTLGLENLCSRSLRSFCCYIDADSEHWACTHHPHIHNSFFSIRFNPPFLSFSFSPSHSLDHTHSHLQRI